MTNREFIIEVLDTLRNMEDAINVICELDADAVLAEMKKSEEPIIDEQTERECEA